MILNVNELSCEGCPALKLRKKGRIRHCESLREKQIDSMLGIGVFILCESIPQRRFVYDPKSDYANSGLRYNLRRELVDGMPDGKLFRYLRDNFVLIVDCALCPLHKLKNKRERRVAATI